MVDPFKTRECGNSGNGFNLGKRDSIMGFSTAQVEEACTYPPLYRWIYRGSHRRRRMRILLGCVWYHEMEPDRGYTTDEITQMCLEHDARGQSAMIISNQRVGTLFRVFIARGMIKYRTVKGKREYLRGEINENEV